LSADKLIPVTPLRRMGNLGISPLIVNRGTGLNQYTALHPGHFIPLEKKAPHIGIAPTRHFQILSTVYIQPPTSQHLCTTTVTT